jgi:hypothetical protein
MATYGDMPDKLIVRGIPAINGEYPCNVVGMMLENTPHTMTNREGHRVKVMTGVRTGELWDAMQSGDNDVLVALAAVILTRAGKRFSEEVLWDSPMGSALEFDIADRDEAEEDAEPDDPTLQLPLQLETTQPDADGGKTSSSETSALLENGQSSTGTQAFFPSDLATSES